jgi:hypothetical protein
VGVIYLAMTSMACFNIASDLAMFTASVILLATEVITRDEFLQGFGNSSVVCVGLLLVVAKGVEEVRREDSRERSNTKVATKS